MPTRFVIPGLRLLLLAMFLIIGTEASAQDYSPVRAGTRVRIFAPALADTLLIGTLDYVGTEGVMTLIPDARSAPWISIPGESLQSLEVSRGRAGHALVGTVFGAGVGAAAGYGLVSRTCTGIVCGAAEVGGAVGGGLLGALTGALVGHAIPRGPERWVAPRGTRRP